MRKWIYKKLCDEALMAKYASGNTDAFEHLYLRNKDVLFSFIRRQCNNHEVAEELAHDTWLAVIRQAKNYQAQAQFKTWLYRIAHNRLIDHWRKYGNSTKQLIEEVGNQLLVNTQQETIGSLEVDELFENLKNLTQEQMEALLLKIEGFSHSEIADITNAKQETVKSRLRYAVKHLRLTMEATS